MCMSQLDTDILLNAHDEDVFLYSLLRSVHHVVRSVAPLLLFFLSFSNLLWSSTIGVLTAADCLCRGMGRARCDAGRPR